MAIRVGAGDMTDHNDERFHREIMCHPLSVTYDFSTGSGLLVMDEGDCCDMAGCIALFSRIDPNVQHIQTVAGSKRDTAYQRKGEEWRALWKGNS
jgi:hypothetical protein